MSAELHCSPADAARFVAENGRLRAELAAKGEQIAALNVTVEILTQTLERVGAERDAARAQAVAEIAALREALGHIAIKRAWHELTTNECWEAYSDMRRIARAALEMSGGVK